MSVEHFISLEKAQLAVLTSQLDDLQDLLKQSKGDLALLLASTAPPPIGTGADVVSLGVSIGRGDWGGAFWDVIGLVPVVGDGVKGAVKGTKLASKIADITAAIAKARKKIADRTKNIRKNAQKKCDKLVKNTKKRKSDKDAATDCGTNCGGGKGNASGARLGERRISKELYDDLRSNTPNSAIRDKVNKGKIPPYPDEALPGMTVTKRLEADHIVPMDKITRMEGFDKLTKEQQLSVLNNPDNFIGLSKSANTSKGSKSFEEWTEHKKSGTSVDPDFRENMIKVEKGLEVSLQQQIDDLAKLNSSN